MATFKQRPNGTWRAEIIRVGIPYQSKDGFATKRAAQAWAGPIEFVLKNPGRHTLHNALQRYVETVSIHKRGKRWEALRIAAFKRDNKDRALAAADSDFWAKWRDDRLKEVSTGTVRREMNLLGHVLETAVIEWKWLDANPLRSVTRPPDGKPRDRVLTDEELANFISNCRTPIEVKVGAAFAFAVETGMRAGEVVGILPEHIAQKTVILPLTKNGSERRVPLSKAARKLIPLTGFGLTSAQLDIHFRNVRDRLGQDYTFHSARHTAATRIGQSGKLTPFELCKMFGWKDLNMAMRYCHSSIIDMADRL